MRLFYAYIIESLSLNFIIRLMHNRILFLLKLYFGTILFFELSRLLFILFHYHKFSGIAISAIIASFGHGFMLDISATSYIMATPLLVWVIAFITNKKWKPFFIIYFRVILVVIAFINIADLEIYQEWGTKINALAISYLKYPAEAVASSSSAPISLLLFLLFVLIAISWIGLNRVFKTYNVNKDKPSSLSVKLSLCILLIGIVGVGVRGGIGLAPINQSTAYFSGKPILNHTAINTLWNLFDSMNKEGTNQANPYQYYASAEAKTILNDLYKNTTPDSAISILNTTKPNIVLIIVESFTADVVESLGGEKGIDPEIEKLIAKGLLFNNAYASGDRTDKGLVAVLSAFPSQAAQSIIKQPDKFEHLPTLSNSLLKNGYHTAFYYGGESEFANIKAYMLHSGYQNIVDKKAFDKKDMNSKWGVHDHVLFQKVAADMAKAQEPFFTTIMTLSNHEPFEIPIPYKFPHNDEAGLFRNTAYYTDQSIGKFIKDMETAPCYKNTLFILVADHGHRLPRNYTSNSDPRKFRIPLLFFGDALKDEYRGKINSALVSQTDIAATLLGQLNVQHADFKFTKDVLLSHKKQFAFYSFSDGFGWVTPNQTVSFDNVSKKIIELKNTSNQVDSSELKNGKAYMQSVFQQYLDYK
jgi:phosphoglycerol transferase MdoB-like AlkP superfamily enzyme